MYIGRDLARSSALQEASIGSVHAITTVHGIGKMTYKLRPYMRPLRRLTESRILRLMAPRRRYHRPSNDHAVTEYDRSSLKTTTRLVLTCTQLIHLRPYSLDPTLSNWDHLPSGPLDDYGNGPMPCWVCGSAGSSLSPMFAKKEWSLWHLWVDGSPYVNALNDSSYIRRRFTLTSPHKRLLTPLRLSLSPRNLRSR